MILFYCLEVLLQYMKRDINKLILLLYYITLFCTTAGPKFESSFNDCTCYLYALEVTWFIIFIFFTCIINFIIHNWMDFLQ